MIGESLGPYRILEPLGAGGMGEVYLGEDTRLGRKVAIKVLPAEFASDPERLARFEQEARAAAALNHPHIATVHDVGSEVDEEGGTTHFMVQEYLQGEVLRKPLEAGPLPLRKMLSLAAEVAEALVAAHRAGIIHRDLKPDNVFITADGHAKVLDFGLAKLTEAAAPAAGSLSMSPTVLGTVAGQIMGTAGYMAPEQAAGAPDIDRRADLFAFGSLLYEMSCGRQPFAGRSVAETLSLIQHEEPPALDTVDDSLPADLARIIGKCLEKDPADRYQHADDLVVDLRALAKSIASGITASGIAASGIAAPGTSRAADATTARASQTAPQEGVSLLTAGVAAIVLAAVSAIAAWNVASSGASDAPLYFTVKLPEGLHLWGGSSTEARIGGNRPSRLAFAVAPDGESMVFAATDGESSRLYLRRWDNPVALPIAGTEDAAMPFFSPDGLTVGFVAGDSIKTVPLAGGVSSTTQSGLSSLPVSSYWSEDDTIFTSARGRLIARMPSVGGEVEAVTENRSDREENSHLLPYVLPGGEAILYTIERERRDWGDAEVAVQTIGGESEVLLTNAADARYVPTDHVVFVRQGVLMAAGFDLSTRSLTTPAAEIRPDVMQAIRAENSGIDTGAAQYSFSPTGTFAYASGGILDEPEAPLFWVAPDGSTEELEGISGRLRYLRLSRDGRRVAASGPGQTDPDIVVYNLSTPGQQRLRLPGRQSYPQWSPDGASIAFASNHEGDDAIYTIPADLSGDPRKVVDDTRYLSDWSVHGLVIMGPGEIWLHAPQRDADGRLLVDDVDGGEGWPAFSPDGKWLAYATVTADDERPQVFVVTFPGGAPVYPVSAEGGTRPTWSRSGDKIFFRSGGNNYRNTMMVVDVAVDGNDLRYSEPRRLFDREFSGTTQVRSYDVAADGRFIMVGNIEHAQRPVTEINVVLNWFEELKARVPTSR